MRTIDSAIKQGLRKVSPRMFNLEIPLTFFCCWNVLQFEPLKCILLGMHQWEIKNFSWPLSLFSAAAFWNGARLRLKSFLFFMLFRYPGPPPYVSWDCCIVLTLMLSFPCNCLACLYNVNSIVQLIETKDLALKLNFLSHCCLENAFRDNKVHSHFKYAVVA